MMLSIAIDLVCTEVYQYDTEAQTSSGRAKVW